MADLRPNSEVADGVHWIKDGFVNAYIVEQMRDSLHLIDSGFNKKAKGILNYIRDELEARKIEKVFLTHHHMDHTRGLRHIHTHLKPTV
ncbi:MAG: MBL fold metallo-hydrolase, partial [Candidatus Kariarchaeaceae archaeon]